MFKTQINYIAILGLLILLSLAAPIAKAGEVEVRPAHPQVGGNIALYFTPNEGYPGNPFMVATVYGFTPLATEPVVRSTVLNFQRSTQDFRGQFFSELPFVYLLIEFTDGNVTDNNNGKFYSVYMHNREHLARFAPETAALCFSGLSNISQRPNTVLADSLIHLAKSSTGESLVFSAILDAYQQEDAEQLEVALDAFDDIETDHEVKALLDALEYFDLQEEFAEYTLKARERFPMSFVLYPYYGRLLFAGQTELTEEMQQYVEASRTFAEKYGKEEVEHLFVPVFRFFSDNDMVEDARQLIEEQYVHPHLSIPLARKIGKNGDMHMALELVAASAGIAEQKIRWFEENLNHDVVKYNQIIRDNARLLFVLALLEYEDGINDDIVLSRISQGLQMLDEDVTSSDYEQVLDIYLSNGKLKDAFSVIMAAASNELLTEDMEKSGEGVFEELNRRRMGEDTTSFQTLLSRVVVDNEENEVNSTFDRMYELDTLNLHGTRTSGETWRIEQDYTVIVHGGDVLARTMLADSLARVMVKNSKNMLDSERIDVVVWNTKTKVEDVRAARDNTKQELTFVLDPSQTMYTQYGAAPDAGWILIGSRGELLFDDLNADLRLALRVLGRHSK